MQVGKTFMTFQCALASAIVLGIGTITLNLIIVIWLDFVINCSHFIAEVWHEKIQAGPNQSATR